MVAETAFARRGTGPSDRKPLTPTCPRTRGMASDLPTASELALDMRAVHDGPAPTTLRPRSFYCPTSTVSRFRASGADCVAVGAWQLVAGLQGGADSWRAWLRGVSQALMGTSRPLDADPLDRIISRRMLPMLDILCELSST